MPLGPEHRLQVACHSFVDRVVERPFVFTSVDRRQKSSALSHVFEKNRGIRKGTSDCFLAQLLIWGWQELKAPGRTPDDFQKSFGADVVACGGFWFWADSVTGYWRGLAAAGITMHPRAELLALDFDLRLSVAKPAKGKRTERPAQRPERVSAARMARANATYIRTLPR